MRVPFRLVDVFAEAPFGGNQLCVVPEVPVGLDDETMQALAMEIGFSETTFVTAVRPDGYDVRIFTPEVGAAVRGASDPRHGVHARARRADRHASTVQHCAAGDIPVRDRPRRWPRGDAAASARLRSGGRRSRRRLPRPPGSSSAISSTACRSCRCRPGSRISWCRSRDDEALRRAARDDRGCERVCASADDAESLYLFAVRGDGDIRARMFDRFPTIGEDPATGSAAGPLGSVPRDPRTGRACPARH